MFETISLIDVIWLNQDFDFGFSGKSQVSGFIRKLKNIPGWPAYFVQRVKLDCSGFSIFQIDLFAIINTYPFEQFGHTHLSFCHHDIERHPDCHIGVFLLYFNNVLLPFNKTKS
ncbi:hypothetical protein NBRC111894_3185 [Sporolactobacillus inulinus]|uniref:Uncharacterized protein n=1 Tax=Sporolactobacillus inulinus TaxID=2078 RepID=A0A4Y1ZF94_9BACL|nr:hypothetical protein NBRC111894_3185 [Sporolactobacillus inulinus]